MRVLAITLVLFVAARAHAGMICATDDDGNDDPRVELKALEAYAKTGKVNDGVGYAQYCLGRDDKDKARILAACQKILDRDAKFDACRVLAADLATPMLGKHDIFAWVAKAPLEPWNMNSSVPDYPLWLFQRLADPRAATVIVTKWKALIPIEAKHEKSIDWMTDWSGWRQHAAEALATTGTADDATFLIEQAGLTKDTHVKQACLDAAAAIAKRATK